MKFVAHRKSLAHLYAAELGQAKMRIVISWFIVLYIGIAACIASPSYPQREALCGVLPLSIAVFGLYSFLHIYWVRRRPEHIWFRLYLTPFADLMPLTWLLALGGDLLAPLFTVYLWVTIGNGLRFGSAPLVFSACFSVVCFAIAVAISPDWQQHPHIVFGIFLTLSVPPLYVLTLVRQLHRSMAEAADANRAKSQFLARMSHELRTPLHAIVSTTDMLSTERYDDEAKDNFRVLRESVDSLLRQVDHVLDLSKIEAGKIDIGRFPLNLYDVLANAISIFEPRAAQQGLALELSIASDVPFAVVGDATRLSEILRNFVSNAVKFTPAGTVNVSVEWLETHKNTVWLRFTVRDTGIGIASEFLPKIFDSFMQEDGGATRTYGGTGLGTTISKQLIESMGGRVTVQSEKGVGTTFAFDLPFDKRNPCAEEIAALRSTEFVFFTNDEEAAQKIRRIAERQIRPPKIVASADSLMTLMTSARNQYGPLGAMVDASLDLDASVWKQFVVSAGQNHVFLARIDVDDMDTTGLARLAYQAYTRRPRLAGDQANHGKVDPRNAWKILVADDNAVNRLLIRRMLGRAGYDVTLCVDGTEALERIRTGRHHLAIIDVHMPGQGGLDIVRQLRDAGDRTPLMVLSADVTEVTRKRCETLSAPFLAKPVRRDTLIAAIEAVLAGRPLVPTTLPVADNTIVVDRMQLEDALGAVAGSATSREMIVRFLGDTEKQFVRIRDAIGARNFVLARQRLHTAKGLAAMFGANELARTLERCERHDDGRLAGDSEFILDEIEQAIAGTVDAMNQLESAS